MDGKAGGLRRSRRFRKAVIGGLLVVGLLAAAG